jgi:hypothetical protein
MEMTKVNFHPNKCMDWSQEREKPLFVERLPDGSKKFVSIADIEGSKLASPDLKKKIGSLTQYLVKHLGIQQLPNGLKLINSKKNADNDFGLTGHYDHTTKLITIYITDRHDTDILRSFAHEMIHHWQNERGTLHPPNGEGEHDGNNHEHYAQHNQWLRKREMEAYLLGNLLFRDFQDEQRYGPPKTPTVLPQPYD